MSAQPRGTCCRCGANVAIRKNGDTTSHKAFARETPSAEGYTHEYRTQGISNAPVCPGAGTPAEVGSVTGLTGPQALALATKTAREATGLEVSDDAVTTAGGATSRKVTSKSPAAIASTVVAPVMADLVPAADLSAPTVHETEGDRMVARFGRLLAKEVPLKKLHPSPFNKRRTWGDLEELADSFKAVGVLEDLLARPHPTIEGEFELVFGHRRRRAATIAGLEAVPVKIRELTDAQVVDIQVIENLQRTDIHPLEEAESFEQAMKVGGVTAEDLAAKVGKSRSYVFGRMKLLALCEKARQAFAEDKINASVALHLARVPHQKQQEEALAELTDDFGDEESIPVREAKDLIERRYMLRLASAPFDVSDAGLLARAGSCTSCPKRTGNQPELFADVVSRDVCTDTECFGEKKVAHAKLALVRAREEGREVLEGKEAQQAIRATRFGASAFVDLDEHCWEDEPPADSGEDEDEDGHDFEEGRTHRKILEAAKGKVDVVLAVDRDGKVHELVRRPEFAKAVATEVKISSKVRAPESPRRPTAPRDWEAENEKRRRQEELEDARDAAIIAAVVERAERLTTKVDVKFWRFFAELLIESYYDDVAQKVGERRGLAKTKATRRLAEKAVRGLIPKLDEAHARALCVELALAGGDMNGDKVIAIAAKYYGVDAKKIGAAAIATKKAEQAAKAKKPEGKGKSTAKKQPAKKSARGSK